MCMCVSQNWKYPESSFTDAVKVKDNRETFHEHNNDSYMTPWSMWLLTFMMTSTVQGSALCWFRKINMSFVKFSGWRGRRSGVDRRWRSNQKLFGVKWTFANRVGFQNCLRLVAQRALQVSICPIVVLSSTVWKVKTKKTKISKNMPNA